MALSTGDLPYVALYAVGTNPETRVNVDFTFADDTGGVTVETVTDAVKQALLDSGVVATVSAFYRTVTDTEI